MIVALITGLFNFLSQPAPLPPATPSPIAVEHTPLQSAPVRTAALDTPSTMPTRQLPIYSLNFAAFQAAMKDRSMTGNARQETLNRVVGNAVLWQGFVDELVFHDDASLGWTATLSLVETVETLNQTLFKHPAFCRFSADDVATLESVQRGDFVKITGDCVSHNPIATEVRNCRVADVRVETVVR